MKKLYLHLGYLKTASTSFQESCAQNIDMLFSQGFLYEKMGVDSTRCNILRKNEGISNFIVRVQAELNKREEISFKGKINPNFLRIMDLDHKSFTQKYFLTEKEFEKVKHMCDAENAYFKKYLGEEFTDKEIVFAPEDIMVNFCTELIERIAKMGSFGEVKK